jgi:hypothetical protein
MRLSEHVRELRPHAEFEAIKIIAQAGLGGGVITIAYRIVGSHLATVGWVIAFLVSAALFGISLWMPRSRRVPNASIEQGGTQLRTQRPAPMCFGIGRILLGLCAPADPGSGPDRALRSTAVRQAHRRGETSATVRRCRPQHLVAC